MPAAFPLGTSFITLIFVAALSKHVGISSIVYGTLTGSLAAFLFMFWNAFKKLRYQWSSTIFHPELRSVWLASIPLFAAGVLFRSTYIFERFFAARMPEGSLSYLGSGNQIIVILSTIVSSGIATTSFPLLANYWQQNDMKNFEKTFSRITKLIVFIVLPMIAIFIVSGIDIIRILFEYGAFTSKDTVALYYTLLALMGYFLFSSIGNIAARVLYTSNKTLASSLIATFELLAYLSGALFFGKRYGYIGLALSISVASGINILVSFAFIHRRIISLKLKELFLHIVYIVALSTFTFLLVFLFNVYLLMHINIYVRLLISSGTAIGLYLFLSKWVIKKRNITF
jgi:putative peptidoglycan lipid II flippase